MFEIAAPAKINLYLKVFEKRADGFHRMETVMLKVGLFDHLQMSIEDGDGVSLEIEGSPDLEIPNNLVVRAAESFLRAAHLRKKIHIKLTKNIFLSAGLGGGSSDAAATLTMLSKAFPQVLSFEKFLELAAQLGSDVPFFLYDSSLGFAHGRGEKIIPWASLPKRWVILVNPGFGMSTAKVYQTLARPQIWESDNDYRLLEKSAPTTWPQLEQSFRYENDLQPVVEGEFPVMAEIRKELKALGAHLSMMSGSGSTVFGMFEAEATAQAALEKIKNNGFRAVLVSSL